MRPLYPCRTLLVGEVLVRSTVSSTDGVAFSVQIGSPIMVPDFHPGPSGLVRFPGESAIFRTRAFRANFRRYLQSSVQLSRGLLHLCAFWILWCLFAEFGDFFQKFVLQLPIGFFRVQPLLIIVPAWYLRMVFQTLAGAPFEPC